MSTRVLFVRSCDPNGGSCDSDDESCDLALEAILEGLNKWDGINMEISQIDHLHSYKLLSTLLELASLLLEVCACVCVCVYIP